MIARPDILVKSANEVPVAIVEIKNRRNLTPTVAQEIRRNLLAHGPAQPVRFFILVSQDRGYVWRHKPDNSLDSAPDAEFSMLDVVKDYVPEDDPDRRFRESELELIVMSWLWDLSAGTTRSKTESERVLADLGFITAVRDGSVLVEQDL